MKTIPLLLRFLLLPAVSVASPWLWAAEDDASTERRIGLLTFNRAGTEMVDHLSFFEEQMGQSLAGPDTAVVSRDLLLRSIASAVEGIAPGNEAEYLYEDGASALALARQLNLDLLVIASLQNYTVTTRDYQQGDIASRITEHRLRASYRVVDPNREGTLGSHSVTVREAIRQTARLTVSTDDLKPRLVARAAEALSDHLREDVATLRQTASGQAPAEDISFTVQVRLQGLELPDVALEEDGTVRITERRFPLTADGVNVEVDGLTIGSAPGPLKAPRGIQRLRLSRAGFQPFERMVNLHDGFTLQVEMVFTPEGRIAWERDTHFLQSLRDGERLSEAQAEVLRGEAQRLRQSGVRIDVQTTEGLTFEINENSLFR